MFLGRYAKSAASLLGGNFYKIPWSSVFGCTRLRIPFMAPTPDVTKGVLDSLCFLAILPCRRLAAAWADA
ncbi:hypothetical protein CPter91_1654 [Collimonas pratensis]|uniref:Uncharacterized protein n=1 Tax=Collimonas pratensis TaxID=279113 RepID=A0A127Q1W2_9BURK|nr:hypothetical protein CPter91_1654 [Collimonas pratensis]